MLEKIIFNLMNEKRRWIKKMFILILFGVSFISGSILIVSAEETNLSSGGLVVGGFIGEKETKISPDDKIRGDMTPLYWLRRKYEGGPEITRR